MNKVYYLFLLIFGSICVALKATPIVDGNLSDSDYDANKISKENTNTGFGTADIENMVFFIESLEDDFYFGIEGGLPTGNNDGIGIFVDFSEHDGRDAGEALGGIASAEHFMGNVANAGFKFDGEVDYMFALTSNSTATEVRFGVVKFTGNTTAEADFIAATDDQLGTPKTGPSSSGVFGTDAVTFAFNNSGATDRGFEMKISFDELGLNASIGNKNNSEISALGTVRGFAFVVTDAASFSDITIPGDVTTGNIGTTPDFSLIAGGPFYSNDIALPVTLSLFEGKVQNGSILLNWATSSELNNAGFILSRKNSNQFNFSEIASYKSHFSLVGKGNSTTTSFYHFEDKIGLIPNTFYDYKIASVDFDGNVEETSVSDKTPRVLRVFYPPLEEEKTPLLSQFELIGNFPNPFNPKTTIAFETPKSANVKIEIFNVLGEKVRVLAENGESKIGRNTIVWDGKDDFGKFVNSGIFFYKVTYNGLEKIGKMLMLK